MMRAVAKSIATNDRILSFIGKTPLIRLENIVKGSVRSGVRIYAKAEWFNPGGSVKDRAALNMIREGERSGALTKDKIILDATSGNTGIAYAMIGAVLGYRVQLAVPANAGIERKRMLAAYGADVIYTDPLEGTDGAQRFVRGLVKKNPERYFYPDQYNNPANWQAHYKTTAPEIFGQTDGAITHVVAGLGTTGTFVGVARRLKELNAGIQCISVQPDSPLHGLEGLKHLGTALVPGIYDSKLADANIDVSTEDAYEMTKRLAREEGLLVGNSSGAALAAALAVARDLNEGSIVAIFPDGGEKYLNDSVWEN
ncbi:MAG: cysteine synthase family protein [Ignavibacteriae bacterium]|nr:cysteine synthase family protein [Ignavibacteriota bacterium]